MLSRIPCVLALAAVAMAPIAVGQTTAASHPVSVTYYRVFDGHREAYATVLAEKGRPVYDKLVEMGVFRRSSMYWQESEDAEWQLVSLVEWESAKAMEAGSGASMAAAVDAVFPGMTVEEWAAEFAPHREVVRHEVWATGP